ncbi:SUF system Fe-S cluster assembly regulator [Methylococcus sp. ANG]|jgi:FeS assembly SUF system regulator|uniref:SUF system Fe-S cluster assembly regulator n=1 Tax=unclassified Methylococcus TaxID=2618889 RepID=UPI001C52A00C|nr:SUF system Fe-S cluster assembly regulator [Methylococcus sp. Mc7]QXP84211.1 SUF system Fe-S cluster assembly regulator [Methylococcus sp. Mc7]
MLRISKLTDYAIIILGQMARSDEQTFAAAELADQTSIAMPTASKILKALARAGIVTSTRGSRGGYALAQKPEHTSVARIIGALEGPIALTECSAEQALCQQSSSCDVRSHWNVINRAVQTALESVSLADMIRPVSASTAEVPISLARLQPQPR